MFDQISGYRGLAKLTQSLTITMTIIIYDYFNFQIII